MFSQVQLSGVVVDREDEPLPFVNILVNEKLTDGVSTDIDGRFIIDSKEEIQSLTLSFVGFEKMKYEVKPEDFRKKLQLVMTTTSFELQEAVVIAGENPAHRIIRKVIANRSGNNPLEMKAFQCLTYNKMVFEWMPQEDGINDFIEKHQNKKRLRKRQSKNFEKLLKDADQHHIFLMESVTERKYQFPEKNSERILFNRVSGLREPTFAALANAIQPFSFYKDYLEILDKAYLNPISKNSTSKYYFNIEDTLLQQLDTIFVLSFKPRKGKNFEGLKGVLYVHTDGYALQNVIAEPNDKSFIHLKIEQKYVHTNNEQWFPEQLNFVIEALKYPHPLIGLRVSGKSYISQVRLDPTFDKKDFVEQGYIMDENANIREDSIWQKYRSQELTDQEKATYQVIDSIGKKKKFDSMLKGMEALASGRWSIKKVDFHISKVLAFNDFEDTRLGLGISTNDRLSPFFEVGGYAGWGTADKEWKYGGHLLFKLMPKKKLHLRFDYQQDLHGASIPNFTSQSLLFSQQLYSDRMDAWENRSVRLLGKIGTFTRFNVNLAQQIYEPLYDYDFVQMDINSNRFNFTEIGLNIHFSFRAQVVQFLGTEISESRFPQIHITYKKGIEGWLDGAFDYQKILLAIDDDIRIRHFGEMSIRLEAGLTSGGLPFGNLFSSSGIGRGFQWLEIDHTFQTMDRYEFLSDRFVNLFFQHNFGTLLLKTKNFKPEFSVVQNIGIGSLAEPELHQNIEFQTLEKGYFESGVRIDNILRINYVNIMYLGLGGGIYYRYGPYALPATEENLAYRFRLQLTF